MKRNKEKIWEIFKSSVNRNLLRGEEEDSNQGWLKPVTEMRVAGEDRFGWELRVPWNILDDQVAMSRTWLDIEVWGSGEKLELEIHICYLVAQRLYLKPWDWMPSQRYQEGWSYEYEGFMEKRKRRRQELPHGKGIGYRVSPFASFARVTPRWD